MDIDPDREALLSVVETCNPEYERRLFFGECTLEDFDGFDRPHASSANWYINELEELGAAPEIFYRDGFWTVIRAKNL